MKTIKLLTLTLSLILTLILTGCFDTARDNIFDPGGEDYDPYATSNTVNSVNNDNTNTANSSIGTIWIEHTYTGDNFAAVAYCLHKAYPHYTQ